MSDANFRFRQILSTKKDKEAEGLKTHFDSRTEMKELVETLRRKVGAYFYLGNQVEFFAGLKMKMEDEEKKLSQERIKVRSLAVQLKQIKEENDTKLQSLAQTLREEEEDLKVYLSHIRREEEGRFLPKLEDLSLILAMTKKEEEKLSERSMELELELCKIASDHRVEATRNSYARLVGAAKEKAILQIESERLPNEHSLSERKEQLEMRREIHGMEKEIKEKEEEIRWLDSLLTSLSRNQASTMSDDEEPLSSELLPNFEFESVANKTAK